ncbi:MAG: hypothetical protein J6C46_06690 [Clostridia bacterium]|nr:hypothetical protein [Clostridia bacterium]
MNLKKNICKIVLLQCTTKGYSIYKCSKCNETTQKNYVKALGHDYIRYTLGVLPTCTNRGYSVYSCSRCGESMNKNYKRALGHKDNNYDKRCNVCGVKTK